MIDMEAKALAIVKGKHGFGVKTCPALAAEVAAFGRECAAEAVENEARLYSLEFGHDAEHHGEMLARVRSLRGGSK